MSIDTDDPFVGRMGAVGALTLVTVFAWLSFIFLPVLVDLYIHTYGFSQAGAGTLAGIEVGALTVVALALSSSVHRRDKRVLCIAAALLVGAGNGCSLVVSGPFALGFARTLVGAGLGLAVASVNALPALARKSEFLYALGQLALCVVGSLLIFGVPVAVAHAGPAGIFWLEIGMAAAALLVAPALPAGVSNRAAAAPARLHVGTNGRRALGAACLFYIVQTSLWAFAGQAGERAGLAAERVDFYLAASAMCGVGGAGLAMLLGMRRGMLAPLVCGFLAQAVFGLLLYVGRGAVVFVPSVLLITFSSVFVTPYLLALAAELDPLGRLASAAGAFMNLGATVGPIAAGVIAARFGNAWIGYLSALLLVGGLAVVAGPARVRRSTHVRSG